MGQVLKDHNGGLTASVFANYVRERAALEREEKELKDRKKKLKERAGDDGIDWDVMVESIKMSKEDEQTAIDRQNKLTSYMKLFRSPIGERMAFIEEGTSTDDLTDEQRYARNRGEGYRAGLDGKNKDSCPHDPNSEAGRAWAQGWDDGQAENFKGIKAPRAPRGSKRGKGAKANDPTPAEGEKQPEPEVEQPENQNGGEADTGEAETDGEESETEVDSSGDLNQAADEDEAPAAPTTGRMTDEEFERNG